MFGHQATNSSLNRDRFQGKRSFCLGFFSSGGMEACQSHFCITIDHLFVVVIAAIAATANLECGNEKKQKIELSKVVHCSPLCLFFFVSWQSDTASVLCLATFLLGICYTRLPKLQVSESSITSKKDDFESPRLVCLLHIPPLVPLYFVSFVYPKVCNFCELTKTE